MKRFRCTSLGLWLLGCWTIAGSGCGRPSAVVIPPASAQPANHDNAEKHVALTGQSHQPDEKAPAEDRAAKLVADALRPSDKVATLPWRNDGGQRRMPAPAIVEQPELPLPPGPGERLPLPVVTSTKPGRPYPLTEEVQLPQDHARLALPERPRLAAGPLVRLRGPDINQPVPLPNLATALPDRAPLTDPSAEASLAAALAQPLPVRTTPAPFVRLNLPDPFEHRQAVRLAAPPEEDASPPAVVIRK
jgi:hypothetical protein